MKLDEGGKLEMNQIVARQSCNELLKEPKKHTQKTSFYQYSQLIRKISLFTQYL